MVWKKYSLCVFCDTVCVISGFQKKNTFITGWQSSMGGTEMLIPQWHTLKVWTTNWKSHISTHMWAQASNTFHFMSQNMFPWLHLQFKSRNNNSWDNKTNMQIRYIHVSHTQLWSSLTVQQKPERCVRSAAPTLTPEDIPLPRIIHTYSLTTLHTTAPLSQSPQSKTTRPTSRNVRIIITGDWQTACQWALVTFQVRLNKYFFFVSEPHASLWKKCKQRNNQVYGLCFKYLLCNKKRLNFKHLKRADQNEWSNQKIHAFRHFIIQQPHPTTSYFPYKHLQQSRSNNWAHQDKEKLFLSLVPFCLSSCDVLLSRCLLSP